jgi:hypothetical protein
MFSLPLYYTAITCLLSRLPDRFCIGKSRAEARPDVVALAKRLARKKKPKGGALSLRAISASLAEQGHLNEPRRPFAAKSVASMLAS